MTGKNKEPRSTLSTRLCNCITCILGISYRRGSNHSIHKNILKYDAGSQPYALGIFVAATHGWPTLPLVKRLIAVQC